MDINWVEFNLPWSHTVAFPFEGNREDKAALEAWHAEYKLRVQAAQSRSFEGLGLNQPGTLVEIQEEGQKPRTLLIGHMNPNSGACGCCAEVSGNPIVLRYAVLDIPGMKV